MIKVVWMFLKREARIGLAVKGRGCPMRKGALGEKGEGEFPHRAAPSSAFSLPRCGNPQAARGMATEWERGQLHDDSICAVDSVRRDNPP